jgi:hypothetical protein
MLGLIPQGALRVAPAAVVRARMFGARELPEFAVDLRLDAPHRQELKFRFRLAGLYLRTDLELPFPDVGNRRHRNRELYALVSHHLSRPLQPARVTPHKPVVSPGPLWTRVKGDARPEYYGGIICQGKQMFIGSFDRVQGGGIPRRRDAKL